MVLDCACRSITPMTSHMTIDYGDRSQVLVANDGRLLKLKHNGGLNPRDIDPWARCAGPTNPTAAMGHGVRLRKHIRRLQLEKNMNETDTREVSARSRIAFIPP